MKKIGPLFVECEQEFFDTVNKKGLSKKLANYVWNVLLKVQRGYSFNRSHCLAYSLIALQEMNLAYKYPIIFWNCACLINDSGGVEKKEEDDLDGEISEETIWDSSNELSMVDFSDDEDEEEDDDDDTDSEDIPMKTKKKKKAKSINYGRIL